MILVAMWLFGIVGFILFIPHKDRRKGLLAAIMFQAFIWLCDMPSFKCGLLSAPVRIFPKATDLTVTINYFFYPVCLRYFMYIGKQTTVYGIDLHTFSYGFLSSRYMIPFSKDIQI
jgi:hypothetical protein